LRQGVCIDLSPEIRPNLIGHGGLAGPGRRANASASGHACLPLKPPSAVAQE